MRTTINTLEKLCYTKETAPKAFALLYQLATTENDLRREANQTFVDLFQVVLAETSINLESRISILADLEKKGLTELIISAYERGLKSNSFVGHIHGTNENYINKQNNPTYPEIANYQTNIINRVSEIVLNNEADLGETAKKALFARMVEQLHYGESALMLDKIEEIINHDGAIEINLRNKLIELTTKRADLQVEYRDRINAVLEKYKAQGVEEELKVNVINAAWIYEKDAGQSINISSKKAIELAKNYQENGVDWLSFLNILLKGEQRQTFYFAETIAKLGFDKEIIVAKLIEEYKKIPLEEQNSVFVNGFIIGSDDNDVTRYFISKLILQPETEVHGIRQIRFLNPITLADLNNVKSLLQKNPEYLRNLEYLDLLSLSNEEIVELTSWISEINFSFALQIFHEVIRKEDRWDELKEIINKYLYTDTILQNKSFINNSLHIEDLLKISIKDNPTEENIYFLFDRIVKSYDDFNTNDDSLLNSLTYFLLEEYWDISWNYFGDYLSNEVGRNYGLNMFLERYKFDNEKLFEWAQKNLEKYPAVAFQFMDIYVKAENGDLNWDPFARKIIDDFGNQKEVLKRLSSKLSNYLIHTYSAESLYIKRKRFIEELLDHPFDEVKTFVKKEIEYLDFRIKEEKKSGENYELRR